MPTGKRCLGACCAIGSLRRAQDWPLGCRCLRQKELVQIPPYPHSKAKERAVRARPCKEPWSQGVGGRCFGSGWGVRERGRKKGGRQQRALTDLREQCLLKTTPVFSTSKIAQIQTLAKRDKIRIFKSQLSVSQFLPHHIDNLASCRS